MNLISKASNLVIFLLVLHHILDLVESAKVRNYLLNKVGCNAKEQQRIEKVVAKILTAGPHGRKFPETFAQVKVYCRDTNRYVRQVERFIKNCYEKTVSGVASVILYTIKSAIRKYCTRKESKLVRDLLHLGPCANKYIQPTDHCIQQFSNRTQQLFDVKDDKKKINWACCHYVDMIKCVEGFMDSIKCIRPSKEIIMDYFRSVQGNLQETLCGEYNEQTDACERIGPPPVPKTAGKRYYASPMFALIDLLESMESFASPI